MSIVWVISDGHDVSGVGPSPVFWWFVIVQFISRTNSLRIVSIGCAQIIEIAQFDVEKGVLWRHTQEPGSRLDVNQSEWRGASRCPESSRVALPFEPGNVWSHGVDLQALTASYNFCLFTKLLITNIWMLLPRSMTPFVPSPSMIQLVGAVCTQLSWLKSQGQLIQNRYCHLLLSKFNPESTQRRLDIP